MKRSHKVLLISALVFPGFGHFKLKYYKTGLALVFATLSFSAIIVYQGIQTATKILDEYLSNNELITVDLTTLFDITRKALETKGFYSLQLSLYALIATYGFTCWHSYHLAEKEEKDG